MTPGALNSTGRVSLDSIGPSPSSGLPSGSTTRPSNPSPTGTDATLPVRRTGPPSLTLSHSPKSATPTLSSSRLNARPVTPGSSSSISSATQFSRPWTRAMPSPTCRTAPTSARSVSTWNFSIRSLRIDVISSGRNFIVRSAPCVRQVLAKSFEPAAHARVEPHRSGLEDDASDQVWVHLALRLDLAAGSGFDLVEDALEVVVGERVRGRQLDVEDALLLRDERVELVGDLAELCGPALLREQAHEVDDELVGSLRDVREDVGLEARVGLGVLEQQPQLVDRRHGVAQLCQLRVDGVEVPLVLRGLEERTRVDAVRGGYDRLPSSWEKSISPSASSISRFWSASFSDLRVIFSAASRLSCPTSSRIWPSACTVAWSICRRVSSRRRWRASPVSSRTRSRWASPTRRASERISSASDFACPISFLCSSSRLRASSLALSASWIANSMRSRRASISCWIGPNAYLRSTKYVMPKQTIVQIISPGVTWISGFDASIGFLDQDVREDRAEQAVEHDRLGEGEAEPLDALQLTAQLRLAGDRLDHRAEDVADADAAAGSPKATANGKPDALPAFVTAPVV